MFKFTVKKDLLLGVVSCIKSTAAEAVISIKEDGMQAMALDTAIVCFTIADCGGKITEGVPASLYLDLEDFYDAISSADDGDIILDYTDTNELFIYGGRVKYKIDMLASPKKLKVPSIPYDVAFDPPVSIREGILKVCAIYDKKAAGEAGVVFEYNGGIVLQDKDRRKIKIEFKPEEIKIVEKKKDSCSVELPAEYLALILKVIPKGGTFRVAMGQDLPLTILYTTSIFKISWMISNRIRDVPKGGA